MKSGFPARGIISCKNTPTEALQDYVDYKINDAMKDQQSYIKDTKHVLQKVHKLNEANKITENINLVTADFENMYGKMPFHLSKEGIVEYCKKNKIENTKEI